MSRPDRVGPAIWAAAGAALVSAAAIRGPSALLAAAGTTWRAFALVAGVVAAGWAGVRLGVFDRWGRRLVPSTRSTVVVAGALLGWVFVVAGTTNLDVAVVATTPLVLVVAAERGLDTGMITLGVAQAANAGSVLLPTANLTTLLALGAARGGEGAYLRQVWLAWVLVGVVTLAVLAPIARRRGVTPKPPSTEWSLSRIGADLAAMFLLASSLRALLPVGLRLSGGFWPAALGASTAAATANNLPAAAAIHASGAASTWGAVAGLAIGPNLLLTGSVATVIVRRIAREGGVELPVRTFTLVGLVLVPMQLAAAFIGLRLTHAL